MALRSRRSGSISAAALAERLDGELRGDPERALAGMAELEQAGPGDVAFVVDRRRAKALGETTAGLVLITSSLAPDSAPVDLILVDDAYRAAAQALDILYPLQRAAPGVHRSASVHERARLGAEVSVGAKAVIDADAVIGDRSEIGAGAVVGPGVTIGSDCVLFANATVYDGTHIGDRVVLHSGVVLGADGFGFARDGRTQVKVPQVGGVVIGDDVEIGANACVDRGTLGDTVIGAGTKIDNLVQVGHNCRVGRDCAISGLTGLSGSTIIEDGVIVGGNVGTSGHQVIGAGSMIAAKSGVHGNLPPGSVVGGLPHMELSLWRRVVAAKTKLPELLRRVRRLERTVEEMTEE